MNTENKNLPEVLVGGFPNSGTSFLCNLIVTLGKSPGNEKSLKDSDSHNRWGYYEHMPIREIVWTAAGFNKFQPDQPDFLPSAPIPLNQVAGQHIEKIQKIASEEQVEVYKDNALPLVYNFFSPDSKYIITERDIRAIYQSPIKAGKPGYDCSVEELEKRYQAYMQLVKAYMYKEVDCMIVQYEDFKNDFDTTVKKVAHHIGVDLTDELQARCQEIFKPRKAESLKSKLSSLFKKA